MTMSQFRSLFVLIAFITISLTSTSLRVAAQSIKGGAFKGVTTSYVVTRKELTLHEPITLTFQIRNDLPQPIKFDLGQDRKGGFSFTVTKPDGMRLNLPNYRHGGLSEVGTVVLQSGQQYSQSILLNEWYTFSMTGKYLIEGHLINPILVADGSGEYHDPGFSASIEIGQRDELALTKICNALAGQVEASNSYESASEAALRLSYVKDPIAAFYLRRVLYAGKGVEAIAIRGLERIANYDAVQILAEALKSQSDDVSVMARGALSAIRMQTKDPALQDQINQVLKGLSYSNPLVPSPYRASAQDFLEQR